MTTWIFFPKTSKKRKTRAQDLALVLRHSEFSTKNKTSKLELLKSLQKPRSTVLKRFKNPSCSLV
jgi:hypothetical protein